MNLGAPKSLIGFFLYAAGGVNARGLTRIFFFFSFFFFEQKKQNEERGGNQSEGLAHLEYCAEMHRVDGAGAQAAAD